MNIEQRSFTLCGYEAFSDFGFALPLFKVTPSANAWYVAETFRPYDLMSRISHFEQYHATDAYELSERQYQDVSVGDKFPCLVYWDGRPYIGSVNDVFRELSEHTRDLMKFAPITLFDLALYSRSRRSLGHASNAFSKLRSMYGVNAARRWLGKNAVLQSFKLEIDRKVRQFSSGRTEAARVGAVAETQAITLQEGRIGIRSTQSLEKLLDLENLEINDVTQTLRLGRLGRIEVDLIFSSGKALSLSELSSVDSSDVPSRELHGAEKGLQRRFNADPRIDVSGKNVNVGAALRRHVQDSFINELDKFGVTEDWSATVNFSKEKQNFHCVLNLLGVTGVKNASARDTEIYASFDAAMRRISTQVAKSRERRKPNKRRADKRVSWVELSSSSYTLVLDETELKDDSEPVTPFIVAVQESDLPRMDSAEAIQKVRGKGVAFAFVDSESSRINILYDEGEGSIRRVML